MSQLWDYLVKAASAPMIRGGRRMLLLMLICYFFVVVERNIILEPDQDSFPPKVDRAPVMLNVPRGLNTQKIYGHKKGYIH